MPRHFHKTRGHHRADNGRRVSGDGVVIDAEEILVADKWHGTNQRIEDIAGRHLVTMLKNTGHNRRQQEQVGRHVVVVRESFGIFLVTVNDIPAWQVQPATCLDPLRRGDGGSSVNSGNEDGGAERREALHLEHRVQQVAQLILGQRAVRYGEQSRRDQ